MKLPEDGFIYSRDQVVKSEAVILVLKDKCRLLRILVMYKLVMYFIRFAMVSARESVSRAPVNPPSNLFLIAEIKHVVITLKCPTFTSIVNYSILTDLPTFF